jgi:hypothetical protein
MKKLIAIILALITALLVTPNRGVDPSPVAVVNPPQTAITTQVGQVPEESETTAETALVSETEEAETEDETAETTAAESEMRPPETEVTTEEPEPVMEETVTDESIEIPQEPTIFEEEEIEEKGEVKTEGETAECIDEGNQDLVEYKPQIGGQPNPFDNDIPTEIDDRPAEDYIGEDENRPGEGIHF